MIKRKLFIGSSSEGKDIAEKVKKIINDKFEWIEAVIWNDGSEVFEQNSGTLESLTKASRKFDYGILVATNDDVTKSRKKKQESPRDNVIFEMGLFLGSLGSSRAFFLIEEGGKVLSDYNGVTLPIFKNNNDSINIAVESICQSIEKTQNSFNLKPVPSTALAIGYFDSFIKKIADKKIKDGIDYKLKIVIPRNLLDIDGEIDLYLMNNQSDKVSLYEPNSRPTIFKLKNENKTYWDIPTTLTTLEKSINLILSLKEFGVNSEKEEWINREIINFGDTLTVLIKQNPTTKGKVFIEYL